VELSIVVATRNRAPALSDLVESLQLQTLQRERFEVILVDNGSTDDTQRVAAALASRFMHGRALHEPKSGAAAARNTGIRNSSGKIILFLDDDIIADPGLLEAHLQGHKSTAGGPVLGHVRHPWKETGSFLERFLLHHVELFQSFQFPDFENVPFLHFYSCNLSLPRTCFENVGLFDETFTSYGFEDTDLGYRLSQAGYKTIYRPEAAALHNVQTTYAQLVEKRRSAGKWLCYLLQKHPELKETFMPRHRSFRRRLVSWAGMVASPLAGAGFMENLRGTSWDALGERIFWYCLERHYWAGYFAARNRPPGSLAGIARQIV
jgi:glycosyltransferase involved in cell wall biosynthesis